MTLETAVSACSATLTWPAAFAIGVCAVAVAAVLITFIRH